MSLCFLPIASHSPALSSSPSPALLPSLAGDKWLPLTQGRVVNSLTTLQGSSQKRASNFPLGPRNSGCCEDHHVTVWASFQKRLVEPVAPKVPSTLQEGFRASRLEGGFSNKEPSQRQMGSPPGQTERSGLAGGDWS